MNDQFPTSTEARSIFLSRYIDRGYHSVVKGEMNTLEAGPPGRLPSQASVDIHEWFVSLDDQKRNYIQSIVKETALASVFGCLVVLDNLTGGPPLGEKPSDFALYLQSYEDWDARMRGDPKDSIRINGLEQGVEGLHDDFIYALQDEDELGKS